MKLHLLPLLLILLLTRSGFSQDSTSSTILDAFENTTLTAENSYPATALWGYMNGGADLFLEYNCLNLNVIKATIDGNPFVIECFEMETPLDAFGIFSVKTHRCDSGNTLQFCQNRYQLQQILGNYYISIINSTASTSDQAISRKINTILQQIYPPAELIFPTLVEQIIADAPTEKIYYFLGRLGLENRGQSYESFLKGSKDFQLFVLKSDTSEVGYLINGNSDTLKESATLKLKELAQNFYEITQKGEE